MTTMKFKDERFTYKVEGHNRFGVCELEAFELPSGQQVLMVTERNYNTGPSVTNAIEHIVEQACAQLALNVSNIMVVEHYDASSYKGWRDETFDVVRFKDTHPLRGPIWAPMSADQILALKH